MNFKVFGNFFKKKEPKMKFKVLRNVSLGKNKKTGQSEAAKKGDIIELDLSDIQRIDSLMRDLVITPIESGLVSDIATYRVLYPFKKDFNGEVITGNPGSELTLARNVASDLLSRGYVRPTNKDAWYPGKVEHRVEGGAVKKMYDDLDTDAGNQPGFITSWKEGKSNENR